MGQERHEEKLVRPAVQKLPMIACLHSEAKLIGSLSYTTYRRQHLGMSDMLAPRLYDKLDICATQLLSLSYIS